MDRRRFLVAAPVMLGGCVAVGGVSGPPAQAPSVRVGDTWTYDCADGFRLPVRWVETHEVTAVDDTGIAVRVTLAGPTMNYSRVELWQSPGVVKIGAVYDPVETRTFAPPLVRYDFPLTPGASWSQRLTNPDPSNQLVSQVGRYVRVGGYSPVATPTGTFDAIEMRTIMSVDDNHPFRFPTQCDYVTWWSEAVSAKVKETRYATYLERGDSLDGAVAIRAQNTLIVLASYSRAAR